MLIKVCLNGSREPGKHPALPLSPQELAREARRSVDAEARAVHMHPRNLDGLQTLAAQECGVAILAVRAQCPRIPIGLSTAAWIEPDVQQRIARIQSWQVLPDFVSVNFSEPGTADLCSLLFTRGIGVEAGLSTVEDAQLLLTLGIANRCLRLLIEPDEEATEAALATTKAIEQCLDEASIQTPRLLHGTEATTWPLLEVALQRGYDIRVGLEDTLTLPDGRLAHDNAELVAFAYRRAHQEKRFP